MSHPTNPQVGLLFKPNEDFTLAQAVYHSVTGKTEKLTRNFSTNYRVTMMDLEQLHAKCTQMVTQWAVCQSNSNVSIQHLDDNKEQFSSFDRFRIYDSSRTSPAESVSYRFNILIDGKGADARQGHPYSITVRIVSRLALLKRLDEDQAPAHWLRMLGVYTIVVEIDYVDYAIARNMMSMVDSWISQVEAEPNWKAFLWIQNRSQWIPALFQPAMATLCGWALYLTAPIVLSSTESISILAQFLIVAFVGIMVSAQIAKMLGSIIESAIDLMMPLSYLKLNKGDEKIIRCGEISRRFLFLKVFVALGITVVQGVAINILSVPLVKHIFEK